MSGERERISKSIWLHYFNRQLFERGIISAQERNRMHIKIEQRTKQN